MEGWKEEGILNLSWVSGMSHWSGDTQCWEAPEDHIWKGGRQEGGHECRCEHDIKEEAPSRQLGLEVWSLGLGGCWSCHWEMSLGLRGLLKLWVGAEGGCRLREGFFVVGFLRWKKLKHVSMSERKIQLTKRDWIYRRKMMWFILWGSEKAGGGLKCLAMGLPDAAVKSEGNLQTEVWGEWERSECGKEKCGRISKLYLRIYFRLIEPSLILTALPQQLSGKSKKMEKGFTWGLNNSERGECYWHNKLWNPSYRRRDVTWKRTAGLEEVSPGTGVIVPM